MIGDGMGVQQISLGELYMRYGTHPNIPGQSLSFIKNLSHGTLALSMTGPYQNLVVDSACSATQLATGDAARSETIGVNARGDGAQTVLELAKLKGKSTGLVSDTRITHATPAAFAAHRAHRSMENEIAEDMIADKVDVLLSGGIRYFLPKSVNDKTSKAYQKWHGRIPESIAFSSKREDELDLLTGAEDRGDHVVFTRQELANIKQGPILGLFNDSAMPDAFVSNEDLKTPSHTVPSLTEMADKSIEILSKNPKGFFLMVEGGQIDWAGHANDAGWMLQEVLRFDQAVASVLKWAEKRDDTLVIVTADHETGSFGFSYSSINIPEPIKLSGNAFKNRDFQVDQNFGSYQVLNRLAEQSESFGSITADFEQEHPNLDAPEKLCKMVNDTSSFKLQENQCEKILTDYKAINKKSTSQLSYEFFEAFTYQENLLANLVGRVLSPEQNIVWGTGTHTATPVAVMTWGPSNIRSKFTGMLHHTQIGKTMKELL